MMDFDKLFAPGGTETVMRQIDLHLEPMELATVICDQDHFAFLDSSSYDSEQGRYSVLAWRPQLVFRSKGDRISVRAHGRWRETIGDPLAVLERLLSACSPIARDMQQTHYAGGAIGYIGYDMFRFIERYPRLHAADDLQLPDCYLSFYDTVMVHDHRAARWWIVASPVFQGRTDGSALIGEKAMEVRAIERDSIPVVSNTRAVGSCSLASNITKDEYIHNVQQALKYIRAGDIYQVNLSQRLWSPLYSHPFELFTRLRRISPSFYGAYLRYDQHWVISSSPELFLRRQGQCIETRPIKGTRPRGVSAAEDARFERELAASTKDAAELTMIVDLQRNDLGRVCRYDTVEVAKHRYIERLSTVFHTLSVIRGILLEDVATVDLLRATFPGGSITGCPKIRSIEIIDELETTQRNVYTGAIGYLGFDGNLTLNIAIRTLIIKGRDAWFHVGGGIVSDSIPEEEYRETLYKAKAIRWAFGNEKEYHQAN